jgi:hypothetical protein
MALPRRTGADPIVASPAVGAAWDGRRVRGHVLVALAAAALFAAAVVAWLCSEEAGWETGQVIHSEGGCLR